MDEEQQQAQAQQDAAFEQSFAQATGQTYTPTEAPVATAEVTAEPEPQAQDTASEPASQAEASPAATPQGQDAAPVAGEVDDPVILDGLKRSELHRLLSNAADVDNLRKQLDKAHGNIGELKRTLQHTQAPAAAPATAPAAPVDVQQFEQDYPEFANYVRALGITPAQAAQAIPQAAPAPQSAAPAAPESVPAAVDTAMAIEMAVMDRLHKGWQQKLGSPDFNIWLTGQSLDKQTQLERASTADSLGALLGEFDQWATARAAASERSAKGRQRLQGAVLPTGNAAKPQAAISETDAFEAAFKATVGR